MSQSSRRAKVNLNNLTLLESVADQEEEEGKKMLILSLICSKLWTSKVSCHF